MKSYLSWVKNVLCKINTFDADKYHPRQYSVEFSKLCFTFLLSHKICHVSNNLYWQHELLQKLFVAMTLGSMFRYRNLKLKMSYQNYLVPQNLTIYVILRMSYSPNLLFFWNYSLSTKTTVIWTVWLCSISRASSVLWISIRTTIQPVLN